jgi:aminoglycoside phosphotransferase (APT) family kinase protein
LSHLASKGFAGAPRFLGIDSSGREILSYLPGDVPSELGEFSPRQLAAAARLLRDFHDATSDFELKGRADVVCHGDASPCNCVFVDGTPVALIDFDAAHAGSRREDVGYAAWLWLDVGNADLAPRSQGQRIAEFFRSYGIVDPAEALPAILDAQISLSKRSGVPIDTQRWAEGCRRWVERHVNELACALDARTVQSPDAPSGTRRTRHARPAR